MNPLPMLCVYTERGKKMTKKNNKYLIFNTSDEQFAINIDKIITIEKTEYEPGASYDKRIKKVNSYPDYIEGVIALKNKVFPVIEFEYFLNNKKMIRHDENKIILIQGVNKDLGILVNDVYTIVELENQSFEKIYEDVPIFVTERNGKILIIPDFDLILNETEFPKAYDKVKDKVSKKKNRG